MEYVAPAADISSRLALGPGDSGLVGTVRFRLVDNDGTADDPVFGPTTAGIIEDPTGSGSYVWRGTAPNVQGKYSPAWDTGAGTRLIFDEDIVVTRSISPPFVSSGNEYVSMEEFKLIIGQTEGGTYRDEAIVLALETASRMIDGYQGTEYYATTEARLFSPARYDTELSVDDLSTLTTLEVDEDGDGVYETTWVQGTDFYLDPPNESLDGRPGRTIVLRRLGRRRFPLYERGIKITGDWGWAAVPPNVKSATVLLANRFINRFRNTPLAIMVASSNEAVAMARVGQIDPDVATLLANVPGHPRSGLQAVQLG